MRNLALVIVIALFAAAPARAASSVVWLHVPDRATQALPDADVQLAPARQEVATADRGVLDAHSALEEVQAHRRAAGHDRAAARRDVHQAHKHLRVMRRTGTAAQIDAATDRYVGKLSRFDHTRDHVAWHHAQVASARAAVRLARTKRGLAQARLERAQADLLAEHDRRFLVFPPRAFAKQVDRMQSAVLTRRSELEISECVVRDTHTEYVAAND
jgi:hypothetical protein